MPKRISKISKSLKELGEFQVNDWDFIGLIHKDIKDLEIAESFRKLGNIRVTDWDFKSILPAVNRLASQDVGLIDLVKRTAAYKVMDWDFGRVPLSEIKTASLPPASLGTVPSPAEMQALIIRLKNFLQYVVANLIEQPNQAQIKVQNVSPSVLRFKLILVKRDVMLLVGREGQTAAAIRNILKSTARENGIQALLEILSQEDEMALKFREVPEKSRAPAIEH